MPQTSDTVLEVCLLVAGIAGLGAVIYFSLRSASNGRARDNALVADVTRCFLQLARRGDLQLEQATPLDHPIVGVVPIPPRLRGTINGFGVVLALEADGGHDHILQTTLRITNPEGQPDWPAAPNPCGHKTSSGGLMRELCAGSHQVGTTPRQLFAVPRIPAVSDWRGEVRRVETDPERLERWLQLALRAASDMGSHQQTQYGK